MHSWSSASSPPFFSPAPPGGPHGSQTLFSSTADVANPSAVTDAAKIVEGKLNGTGLNLLINNAAIYTPAASLETVDAEEMIRTYKTNAVGPLLVAQVWMKLWGWSSPWRENVAWNVHGHSGDLRGLCQVSQGCRREGTVLGLCPKPSVAPPTLCWANWEQAGPLHQNTQALLASCCSSSSSLL